MNGFETLAALSMEVKIALGLLIAVQLVLDVIAFVDLYKRPVAELSIPNKWIWAAIILFVNTFGAIAYLVIGRKKDAAVESRPQAAASMRASDAADLLYGHKDGSQR